MDNLSLTSMASALPSKLLLLLLSPLHVTTTSSSTAAVEKSRSHLLHLLRGLFLLALHALLFLLRLASPALSWALYPNPARAAAAAATGLPPHHDTRPNRLPAPDEGGTYAARALSHVLAVVTRIPVSSRKYELVRGLADRLLDENLSCGSPALAAVNRAALTSAFSRTLRRLQGAALRGPGSGKKADGSVERILGGVRSRLRRWADPAEEEEGGLGEAAFGWEAAAEKLAAEALWLAEKMAESGAAEAAVAQWGAASGLAQLALSAEPRLQGTFVRISGFLFKHASSKELEGGKAKEQSTIPANPCHQLEMLTSWLPLLCRASNGIDTPVLSRFERAETVAVLEEIIEKLSWDQQEEVLSLWLHHYTACPDSDWPNLEPCYTRWYAISRKLLIK